MTIHTDKSSRNEYRPLLLLTVILMAIFMMSGCQTHAPYRYYDYYDNGDYYGDGYYFDDYGDRSGSYNAFEYYYYPDHHVYYDIHRHIYFYNHYAAGWRPVSVLPKHIVLNHHRRHKLKLHNRHPWKGHKVRNPHRHHDDVAHPHKRNNDKLKGHPHRRKPAVVQHEQHRKGKNSLKNPASGKRGQHNVRRDRSIDKRQKLSTLPDTQHERKARQQVQSDKRRQQALRQDTRRDKQSQRKAASTWKQQKRNALSHDARREKRSDQHKSRAANRNPKRKLNTAEHNSDKKTLQTRQNIRSKDRQVNKGAPLKRQARQVRK